LSRSLTGANSDRLYTAGLPVTANPCSVSLWCYPTLVNGREQMLFNIGTDAGATGWAVAVGTTGNWEMTVNGVIRADSGFPVTADAWHNVAFTLTAGGVWTLYIDGVQRNTSGVAQNPFNPYVGGVSVGCQTLTPQVLTTPPTFERYFTGRIAKVGLWNVALSGADVAALQTALPSAVQTASLQSYWKLCGTASPEPDAGLQDHPLAVTGTAQDVNPPAVPDDCAAPPAPTPPVPVTAGAVYRPGWAFRGQYGGTGG
jgi:hypothetical protein